MNYLCALARPSSSTYAHDSVIDVYMSGDLEHAITNLTGSPEGLADYLNKHERQSSLMRELNHVGMFACAEYYGYADVIFDVHF